MPDELNKKNINMEKYNYSKLISELNMILKDISIFNDYRLNQYCGCRDVLEIDIFDSPYYGKPILSIYPSDNSFTLHLYLPISHHEYYGLTFNGGNLNESENSLIEWLKKYIKDIIIYIDTINKKNEEIYNDYIAFMKNKIN